ncbi:MAG: PepSY-associated TM helix domain-containing protein [Muribaculaceae bacterium]
MKKIFRKIHLWLSIPTGIVITLVCFSGAMLVFEKEITEAIRSDVIFVSEAKAEALPMQELLEKVEETLADSVRITGVTVSADSMRCYQVSLSKPRRASIYVDQYTGVIRGKSERLPFFDTMFRLHRWLLGSPSGADGIAWGKLLTGISTLALVFILLTGVLMWLTNRNKPLTASLAINVTKGWRRFLHDLHVAGGIYVTVFLLALALTGLTWSFSWYRSGFYACFGVEATQGGSHHEAAGRHDEGKGAQYRHGEDHGGGFGGRFSHSPYRHWDALLNQLEEMNPGWQQISIKKDGAEVVPEGRRSLRATDKYTYDRRRGEITGVQPYSSEKRDAKVRSAVYMVHTGSWGGLLTRILTFIAALIGATLPLTGYWLWLRKILNSKRTNNRVPES